MLNEVVARLNKKFGENSVIRASECSVTLQRFSSGSLAIDLDTGGGFPEGRISIVYGDASVTKTSAVLLAAREYLKKYPEGEVAFVDMEHALDVKGWLPKFNIDEDRFYIVSPGSGEEAADAICEFAAQKRNTLIISDSVAAMTPTAELEESADKGFIGIGARLVNRMVRKVSALMRKSYLRDEACPTVILLNQTRVKIGGYGSDNVELPGGMALKFHSSLSIHLRRSGWILDERREQKIKVGLEVAYRIRKCKVWRPESTGTYNFYFSDFGPNKAATIDNFESALRFAETLGLCERKGHSYEYDKIVVKGRDAFIQKLREKPELYRKLVAEVSKLSGLEVKNAKA